MLMVCKIDSKKTKNILDPAAWQFVWQWCVGCQSWKPSLNACVNKLHLRRLGIQTHSCVKFSVFVVPLQQQIYCFFLGALLCKATKRFQKSPHQPK